MANRSAGHTLPTQFAVGASAMIGGPAGKSSLARARSAGPGPGHRSWRRTHPKNASECAPSCGQAACASLGACLQEANMKSQMNGYLLSCSSINQHLMPTVEANASRKAASAL